MKLKKHYIKTFSAVKELVRQYDTNM